MLYQGKVATAYPMLCSILSIDRIEQTLHGHLISSLFEERRKI